MPDQRAEYRAMTERSLSDEAVDTLDQALRQTDPLSRMMLIERALKLHRCAVETADCGSREGSRAANPTDRREAKPV